MVALAMMRVCYPSSEECEELAGILWRRWHPSAFGIDPQSSFGIILPVYAY